MDVFTKTKAVKLRSHLDKYIVADEDQETVRQSRNRHTQRAIWTVELIDSKPNVICLKSCYGNYLTASNRPFLLGMTGNKILQSAPKTLSNWEIEWEPIKDGYQVKLKSWCGKFLRGNGGTPPWRNSVTHDEPCTGSTQRWILWNVEAVGMSEFESFKGCESFSSFSSFSSSVDGDVEDVGSPVSVVSMKSDRFAAVESESSSPGLDSKKSCLGYSLSNDNNMQLSLTDTAMEFFHNAKAVRLRSHHNKYLLAEDDEESVTQDKNGSSKNARWNVEFMHNHAGLIRLKSCHGKYLTASNEPFLLGMTGHKVLQTMPKRLDSSVEWEPVREGNQVKLKTRYGHFLRANGRLPPWRNSVTHDIPRRSSTQDWVLWDVDVVEIQVQSPSAEDHDNNNEASTAQMSHSDSLDFEANSPSSVSEKPGNFSRLESNVSFAGSPSKSEGRTIYYHVADESGDVDDDTTEGGCMIFKGKGVEELTRKLEEETSIDGIVVCTRSPLNGKFIPLRLPLPPNNATMLVVVVPPTSRLAKELSR